MWQYKNELKERSNNFFVGNSMQNTAMNKTATTGFVQVDAREKKNSYIVSQRQSVEPDHKPKIIDAASKHVLNLTQSAAAR